MSEDEGKKEPTMTAENKQEENKKESEKPKTPTKVFPEIETSASHQSRALDQSQDEREDMMRRALGLPEDD